MIGNKIIHLDEVDSTNNYTAKLISEGNVTHGTVILADKQLNGRGQRGNLWISSPNQFTCSYYIEPAFLSVEHLLFLNMGIALAVQKAIQTYLPSENVKIKWPNDILVEDLPARQTSKKIAGILIESSFQSHKVNTVIIGVGINMHIQSNIPNACAFESLDVVIPSNRNLAIELADELQIIYDRLATKQFHAIQSEYLANLWRINKVQRITTEQSEVLTGKITGIDSAGNLLFETNEKVYSFGVKDVAFEY